MSRRTLITPLVALGLLPVLLLGACSSSAQTVESSTTVEDAVMLPKPPVHLPTTTPTTLGITDNVVGHGPTATVGSTIVLHYLGVRSQDGQEFGNTYDSGQPMSVVLGTASVIQGWEQGLIGVQAGTQRQLDIPNDLAYRNLSQGDVIKAGDALTFVMDVLAVVPPVSADDEPVVPVRPGDPVDHVVVTDLVVGDGATWTTGQHGLGHILVFDGSTGERIQSTYEAGAQDLVLGKLIPGLDEGLAGMRVGGRRMLVIPYAQAWGAEGNAALGLPATTDPIIVFDLVAVY